jgi:hypothetical protein
MCPIVRWSTGFAVLTLAVATPQARAQSAGSLYNKWQIDLSGAVVIMGTDIRVDGANGEGTEIDGEDVLGLSPEKFQPRASIRWRPGRRHEIEVGYQFARRTAEKTLERDIVFADSTYTVGLNLKSEFRTDQAFLVYRFAIKAGDRTQLGAGLGIGVFPFKLVVDRLLTAGSEEVTSASERTFTGPTGSIGLYGRFLLGNRWYLETDLRGIALKIDRLDAKIVEGNLAGRYFLSQKAAIELGYGISSVNLTVDPKQNGEGFFSGKLKYPLHNIRLGVVLSP